MRYPLLALALFYCAPMPCLTAELKPEVVSLRTLVSEQNQVENPKASLSGKIESVFWQHVRIERSPRGENKEVLVRSRLTKYDADGRQIDTTDRQINETRTTKSYENGLLVSERGRNFTADGKPVGDEFWQTYQYDSAGRVLDLKRGSGQKLQNHFVSIYDALGRLVRQETRQGETDAIVFTEQYLYAGKPETIIRRIVTTEAGAAKDSTNLRLDEEGNVVELWSKEGYHVHWKYDNHRRAIEQLTDPYTPPNGCDECPLPGLIRTKYEGQVREQIFFEPTGKAVLHRITVLERDGSIASIRYQKPNDTNPEDAPVLSRVVAAISAQAGEQFVVTSWDDRGNWTEKKGIFQPRAGTSITQFIYRRKINYR
jgi:hypothetical protein